MVIFLRIIPLSILLRPKLRIFYLSKVNNVLFQLFILSLNAQQLHHDMFTNLTNVEGKEYVNGCCVNITKLACSSNDGHVTGRLK